MRTYYNNIDHELILHSYRVAQIAQQMGQAIGLSETKLNQLVAGALLHDIGKLYIPDKIVSKPARLTPDEYSKVKDHTVLGCYSDVADWLGDDRIREIIKYHHERFDGTGYPDGLSGKEIPLFARIVCIADSFDAMRTNRGYNNPLTVYYALQEVVGCSGKQFDPELVEVFLNLMRNEPQKEDEESKKKYLTIK